VAQHRERLTQTTKRFLRQHLRQTRKVAQFSAFERLFSLWHIIHVPFFCMMVISVLVHVLAVHMY
jgi:cell division protein FtsL